MAKQDRPPTFDHLKKKGKPTLRLPILLDDEVGSRLDAARRNLGNLKLQKKPEPDPETIAEAEKALEALEAEALENSEVMVFQSIGRKRYDKLVDDHPPTKKQQQEAEKKSAFAAYNPDTFLPALIAASCIEPDLTVDQVNELFDEWNNSEVMALIQSALQVNTTRRTVEWGKG